ncbi:hypothetical protein VTN96DRAFT_1508 [Rasamsonia emersonii]
MAESGMQNTASRARDSPSRQRALCGDGPVVILSYWDRPAAARRSGYSGLGNSWTGRGRAGQEPGVEHQSTAWDGFLQAGTPSTASISAAPGGFLLRSEVQGLVNLLEHAVSINYRA